MNPKQHERIKHRLNQGAGALGLVLSPTQMQLMSHYLDLLIKWNHVYNLTAVRDPLLMVSQHLLDSLAILSEIKGPRILDVGSGAGLPGIPLAIMLPQHQFVLLDSLAKRTRFLSQVVAELSLPNVTIAQERVEKYQPSNGFNTITARALTDCVTLVRQSNHLCVHNGRWVLLKGQDPHQECVGLPKNTTVSQIKQIDVPGLNKTRHTAIIVRQ